MNIKPQTNAGVDPFLSGGSVEEKLQFLLRYAILAPSSHNTQPWRFVLEENAVLLCADRTRALPVVDPFDRELVISCGAALLNLRAALCHFECPYEIMLFPYQADPDVLARVKIAPNGYVDNALGRLFEAIPRRVTNRTAFSPEPPAPSLQQRLQAAAKEEGAVLVCVDEPTLRAKIADVVAEGDRQQFADVRFRRELAAWLHSSRRNDGMPAYALGVSQLLDPMMPLVGAAIRTFDVGNGVAAAHAELALGSPLLACLSTTTDNVDAWLAAGQALERVLLVAADGLFDASYLNQPIEVPSLRHRLRDLVGGPAYPQILLRIGTGHAPQQSPRRPLEDVIS